MQPRNIREISADVSNGNALLDTPTNVFRPGIEDRVSLYIKEFRVPYV